MNLERKRISDLWARVTAHPAVMSRVTFDTERVTIWLSALSVPADRLVFAEQAGALHVAYANDELSPDSLTWDPVEGDGEILRAMRNFADDYAEGRGG